MTKTERQTYQSIAAILDTLKADEYAGYTQLKALLDADRELYTNTKFLQLLKTLTINIPA